MLRFVPTHLQLVDGRLSTANEDLFFLNRRHLLRSSFAIYFGKIESDSVSRVVLATKHVLKSCVKDRGVDLI